MLSVLLLFLSFSPSPAFATIFVDVPFPELVKQSPTIVHGKIGGSSSNWVTTGSAKNIYTFYDVQVDETLKGDTDTSRRIVIREMGGEKDGIGMQVSGSAQFTRGENVVVFLGEENSDGSYEVRGLSSGKFNVTPRPDGSDCLSGVGLPSAKPSLGRDCEWTLAALRRVVQTQGGGPHDPVLPSRTSPLPSPSLQPLLRPSALPLPAPSFETSSGGAQALQLQSSIRSDGWRFAREQYWIWILGIGLVGLLVSIFFKKPKP